MIDTIWLFKDSEDPLEGMDETYADYIESMEEDYPDAVSTGEGVAPKPTSRFKPMQYLLEGRVTVGRKIKDDKSVDGVPTPKTFVKVGSLAYLLGKKTNLQTVSAASIQPALNSLQQLLKQNDVDFRVHEAKISKIDLAITLQVPRTPISYFPVARNLYPEGHKRIEYDGESIYWNKGQQSICIYDKTSQLSAEKGCDVESLTKELGLSSPNWLRYEHKYNNHAEVQKSLRLKSVTDLINKVDHIAAGLASDFKQMFAISNPKLINASRFHQILTLVKSSEQEANRMIAHIQFLEASNGNIDEALQNLCDFNNDRNRQTIYRRRKSLMEAAEIMKQLELTSKTDLIDELLLAAKNPLWF